MPENTSRAHIIGVSGDAPLEHHHYVQGYLYACEAEGKSLATVASYAENLARFQAIARELSHLAAIWYDFEQVVWSS
jgi:hypothetical protein